MPKDEYQSGGPSSLAAAYCAYLFPPAEITFRLGAARAAAAAAVGDLRAGGEPEELGVPDEPDGKPFACGR